LLRMPYAIRHLPFSGRKAHLAAAAGEWPAQDALKKATRCLARKGWHAICCVQEA